MFLIFIKNGDGGVSVVAKQTPSGLIISLIELSYIRELCGYTWNIISCIFAHLPVVTVHIRLEIVILLSF